MGSASTHRPEATPIPARQSAEGRRTAESALNPAAATHRPGTHRRTPPARGATGTQEPQSETPEGRTGFVRVGLERAIRATETMVEGVQRAGVPDTPEGEQVAGDVENWANASLNSLEGAEDSLDEEADSLEQTKRVIFRAMGTGALTFDERGVPTYKTSTGDSLTFPEPTGSVLIAMDGSGKKDIGPAHKFVLAFAELTGKPQHYFAKLPQRDIRVVQRLVQLFLA